MGYTPASVEGEHVVLTGPITGTVTLEDGTRVDVSAPVVVVESQERAAEVAHAIGLHWQQPENVHPQQIDITDDGPVINEFVYDDSHYQAAASGESQEG